MRDWRLHRFARAASKALRKPFAIALATVIAVNGAIGPAAPAIREAIAAEVGGTAWVEGGRTIIYGGGGASSIFTVDGTIAYCSDPNRHSPKNGSYAVTEAHTHPGPAGAQYTDAELRAVVYNGYGAPGFDPAMWPSTDWDGTSMTEDDYYAYTHILVADRMWRNGGVALNGTTTSFRRWFARYMLGYDWDAGTGEVVYDGVAQRMQAKGAPDGFQVIALDTGNNSKHVPGARSQTIVSFIPDVTVNFTKCSADAEFTATNPEYSVAGAEYDIFDASNDAKVVHIVMDGSGHASYKLKPNKRYYAVETKAPKGYKLNTERIEFTTGNSTSEEQLLDDPGYVTFTLTKKDSATQGMPQSGASLEGAEYKVVDANGKTHIGTSDKNGRIRFSRLPIGIITVTETKAPKGYKLDPTPRVYTISAGQITDAGIIELEPEDDFKENVIAFDIELVKYADTGAEESGLQRPAAGVVFQIISNTTGDVVGTIETDERGYASTVDQWFGQGERPEGVSGAIPYDAKGYIVREDPETTPEGYQPCGDWSIGPEEMADGASLSYIVDNDFVTSRIQVVKTDNETGQTAALAGFRFQLLDAGKNVVTQEVWYPNHTELTEFETDATGMVTFPEALRPGTYYIREIAAQPPYLLNGEDTEVVIDNDAGLSPVTIVKFGDQQAKGRAVIAKSCADDGSALAGAEFDVVAMQDVVSPDGSVRAVEGEIVDHVVTGEDGRATTSELYLGSGSARYAFVETKAPSGHVLDPAPREFELSYADQATPLVEIEVPAENMPNELILDKDVLGGDQPLPGTEFAIWNSADEIPAASRDEAIIAVRADNGLKVSVETANDNAILDADAPDGCELLLRTDKGQAVDPIESGTWELPQGSFVISASRDGKEMASAEIAARPGRHIIATYSDGVLGVGSGFSVKDEDATEETPLEWSDEDEAYIVTGLTGRLRVKVSGRTVGTIEADGRAYAEIHGTELHELPILLVPGSKLGRHVTDKDGRIVVKHLSEGAYKVAETAAPSGYLVDDEVREFAVTDDGLIEGDASHVIEIEDDFTKVEVSKRDITNEQEVPGAKLAIIDDEGEVVASWESGTEPHRIDRLEPGRYTLVEEMTPHEYDKATEVTFTVMPTGEIQTVVMHDEPISITAEIDKRQEIADPIAEGAVENGDGENKAEVTVSEKGEYEYSIDFRNTSSTWTDEFTVTDEITAAESGLAVLDSIVTPVAGTDYDGLVNVWFKTNKTPVDHKDPVDANATLQDGHENPWLEDPSNADALGDDGRVVDFTGWRLWKEGLDATEAQSLDVSGLALEEDEVVTAIRLEYGRVEEGFSSRTADWDRGELKDRHDDVADVAHSHKGDEVKLDGSAMLALQDGTTVAVPLDELASAEDGAGWMYDANGDGAPEFYAADAVSIREDSAVERSPLVLKMRVTDAYAKGTELINAARVDAYRNGGGDGLEDHDSDEVVQSPKSVIPSLPQTGTDPMASVAATGLALCSMALLALWHKMRPARFIAYDAFGDRI